MSSDDLAAVRQRQVILETALAQIGCKLGGFDLEGLGFDFYTPGNELVRIPGSFEPIFFALVDFWWWRRCNSRGTK